MATNNERWYHPNITGQGAETLLNNKGMKGSYLFRPSQSSPHDCTLSFKTSLHDVTHVRVRKTPESKYCIFTDEEFNTLTELVQYYIQNPVREKGGRIVELAAPIYREDALTEPWYHGILHENKAQINLITKGQNGSFLVRDSTEQTGSYILSVRTRDKVININILYEKNTKFTINTRAYFPTLTEVINYYRQFPLTHKEQTLYLIQPFRCTSFPAIQIGTRINELSSQIEGNFNDEFKSLQDTHDTLLYSCKEGSKLENIHKNRNKSIMPFDHTLVHLLQSDVYGSMYINANYINTSNCPRYIATQGCLETTINAFWSMIWQEKVSIIIMLTNVYEKGQSKCTQYWPDIYISEPVYFGKISTLCLEITTLEEYSFRHFLINHKDDPSNERHVFQFQFHDWNEGEHMTPSDHSKLLKFYEQINIQINELQPISQQSPIIVQCNDGITRTGTYICIDIIIKHMTSQGLDNEIDIQGTVQLLQTQRQGVISTLEQYKFIYQFIFYYLENASNNNKTSSSPLIRKRHDTLYSTSPLLRSLYKIKSSTKQSPIFT